MQFTLVIIEMKLTQGRDCKQSLVLEVRKLWELYLLCDIIVIICCSSGITTLTARDLIEYWYQRYGALSLFVISINQ
jgi:hypothetical protein